MSKGLVEQASRHAIYTQRFAGHLANLFDPYSEKMKKELRLALMEAPETEQRLSRVNKIVNEYGAISLALYKDYNEKEVLPELEDFTTDESKWAAKSLESAIKPGLIELSIPAPNQVWAAVKSQPLVVPGSNGVNMLEPFIKKWESKRIDLVGDKIRTGFMTGRTNNQIASDIAGKGGFLDKQNRQSVKSMVRTSTNHVSNVARQKTYDDNDDIVKGYEIVATLDDSTSDECKGYDGEIFLNNATFKPMPPFHPNCRTSTSPVLDKRYSLDDGLGTRASRGIEGGRQVPEGQSYYEWLKEQGEQGPKGRAFVQDILGQERGKLFLDGGLSASKFKQLTTDELFRPLPLSELRKKTSLQMAFDKSDTDISVKKPVVKSAKKPRSEIEIESIDKSSKIKKPSGDETIVKSTGGTLSKPKAGQSRLTSKITDEESAYLEYYKGEGFYKSNDILRNKSKYSAAEISSANKMNESINSAIEKSALDGDLTVYRGIRSKELFSVVDKDSIGASIPISSPQSFARDGRIGLTYSGAMRVGDDFVSAGNDAVILRLNAKKGQKALDMESLTGIGNTSESEMLFSSKGKYKIINVEDKFAPDGNLALKIIDVEYED